jgi:hypothetical protein
MPSKCISLLLIHTQKVRQRSQCSRYKILMKLLSDSVVTSILRPSNQLMAALMSLMSSIDSLGMTLEQLREEQTSKALLTNFETLLVAGIPVEHAPDQVIWDLMFLKEMQHILKRDVEEDTERSEHDNPSKNIINSHLKEVCPSTRYDISQLIVFVVLG